MQDSSFVLADQGRVSAHGQQVARGDRGRRATSEAPTAALKASTLARMRGTATSRGSRRCWRGLQAGVLALLVLGLLQGCDRNIEAFEPGEEPSAPDLARIFPGPPAGAGSTAAAAEGTPDRTALPPSRAEGSAVRAAAPIEGKIILPAELASQRVEGAVLFVIARPEGVRGGPPLAVLRIPSPSFPLSFSIGPDNVMIPSMRFEGNISLSARLDADGNAMTRGEGDISSATQESLQPGASGVELTLSERG